MKTKPYELTQQEIEALAEAAAKQVMYLTVKYPATTRSAETTRRIRTLAALTDQFNDDAHALKVAA